MGKNHIIKKGVVVGTICLFMLMSIPLVSSSEIPVVEEKNATPTYDTVDLYLWGGFKFHYKVVNHNNELLPCTLTFHFKNFLVTNNTWSYSFTVGPNAELSNYVDCWPMPFYRMEVLLSESGGKTLKRTGICIAGFNIFLTKEMFYNQD